MSSTAPVYRVATLAEWKIALSEGIYKGGDLDAKSGFIHLSTAPQCVETVRRYFAGVPDLILLEICAFLLFG